MKRDIEPSHPKHISNRFSDPLRILHNEMDRLFDDFFASPFSYGERDPGLLPQSFQPRTDITEGEKHFLLTMDMPGMKREDIKMEVRDNQLQIWGERKTEHEERQKNLHRSERAYGSFFRTFTLPRNVNSADIQAEYADGVLRVAIPKGESPESKSVTIGEGKPGFFERLLGGPKKDDAKPAGEDQVA